MLVETFGVRFTLCGRNDTIETHWNGFSTEQTCGPGTGKSRFLQELVNIIRDKALNSRDEDIASLLGNAVFLNVTYGNGTGVKDFDINIGFRDEIIGQENAKKLTLALVLRTIFKNKHEGDKNINKLAIIVGIDEVNLIKITINFVISYPLLA
ncbi:14207_t:CDS:2 [Funneliformis mosseae]|uniref:14207_t:CDS:1 n=1 Tax=Funneliformis mosseae TaxID=27381 RepID=A0A9N9BUX5_FUNMO|nr:14207_t:CDS:2 [Funneliformis mosseae]